MPRKRTRYSGSSSSDDEDDNDMAETKKRSSKATSSKIVVSSDSSSSSDDDGEWNAKPKAKKTKPRGKTVKKVAKTLSKKLKTSDSEENDSVSDEDNAEEDGEHSKSFDDEKEEGEVDFSDEDNEEFNDGFDEHLMGDEEDRKKLAQMTEKEREQELFNRSEKRELLRTRFEINRKLRLAKKQEMKRKAPERQNEKLLAYNESSSRSVERRRNMEDKRKMKDAMKGLKAEREKKKEKLKQKLKATDVYSDSSDSGSESDAKPLKKSTKKSESEESSSSSSDFDDSDADTKHKSEARKREDSEDRFDNYDEGEEQFIFTIDSLNSIRLSRYKMEKWCHAPFFKETVTGCFVRIGVGNTQIPSYLVAQIVDVVETPKIYTLGKTRTNKGIKLKHADNPDRIYRMEFISNSPFIEEEYDKWYTRMLNDRCDLPTKEFVERKVADIKKAMVHNYSDQDIELIVQEKGRFKDKPINFAVKKTQLIKEKEFAEMNGDLQKAIELGNEIDKLEEESKRLEKLRTHNIAAISYINERNRMRNIKEAEKAIAEAAKESQKNLDDPFTRRKCTPTMVVFNKNKQLPSENQSSSSNNKDNGSDMTLVQGKTPSNQNGNDSKDLVGSNRSASGASVAATANNMHFNKPSEIIEDDSDMFSVHNFDIKIDFDIPDHGPASSTPSSVTNQTSLFSSFSVSKSNGFGGTRSGSGHNSASNRRSLNLDEYKKKKGLI